MQRSLYRPDSAGKNIARFDISNFQYTRIKLEEKPTFLPQFGGTGVYVIQSDVAVNLALTESETGAFRSVAARGGAFIQSNFSGLSIGGIGATGGNDLFIDLVICRNGAQYGVDSPSNAIVSQDAINVVTNTPIAQNGVFMVPAGARVMRSMQLNVGGDTLTRATIGLGRDGGLSFVRGLGFDPRNNRTYPTASSNNHWCTVRNPEPGRFVVEARDIPIFAGVDSIAYNLVGTNLGLTFLGLFTVFE